MTVTLLLGQDRREVDNSLLQSSRTVLLLLSDLQQIDVEFRVPQQYLYVIGIYLEFITKVSTSDKSELVDSSNLAVIDSVDKLLSCFLMESFFDDSTFFDYLIGQAYNVWNEFYPHVSSLPNDRSVYLYSPYEFVPKACMNKEGFFKEWFDINANKDIVLNTKDTYCTYVRYYSNGQVKELDVYKIINERRCRVHEEVWSDLSSSHIPPSIFGQVQRRRNYKDRNLDGPQEDWYSGGQISYRHNYKDGKRDGLQEGWYVNPSSKEGQPKYRHNYKDDKLDGLQEDWYENGQPQYRCNYRDGKKDGLWQAWYDNLSFPLGKEGQLVYQGSYKDGKTKGQWKGWYEDGKPKYLSSYWMGKLTLDTHP